ncbi:MAG: GNAT family N-acetyltransferase [Chlorobi bacterium]|nr:GNAT family N-acetyltransferase [Chlorobiota bacterium]MCI0716161.1 GNAT family N-acetyltransferase [Chlorobiota bacterium]
MSKELFEERKDNYLISTDSRKLDIELIHDYLCNHSYWASGIPFETVKKSIENSVNFGLYENGKLIGFARVVTDKTTFAYLGDVFVIESHRGKGLSKWLMECVLKHPELQGFRRWILLTRDAQGLYSQFGFKVFHAPERCMELWEPDVYKK